MKYNKTTATGVMGVALTGVITLLISILFTKANGASQETTTAGSSEK
ncbi:MAG: hypothetical protein IJH91_06230 [Mogibacterium sp.]|nr:hypothetical protein [Mogibacterium sp.]